MPENATFQYWFHHWDVKDKPSKVHIYATWYKVRRRVHGKANFLFENSVSKCLRGKRGKGRQPKGPGEVIFN